MDLCNSDATIQILNKYNIALNKRFGQNFLTDPRVREKICDAAEITKEDTVLEIGPGIGTMTQYLCERAGHVIAVEIDRGLVPILKNDTLSEFDNVEIINDDIMKVDINKLVEEKNGGKPIKVVANLPYYITTPIIMSLLEKHVPLYSITVMIQKEVAERMSAGPSTKDYGALSLAVQYYTKPYLAANVPANCFIPRPKVGSAVISLKLYEEPKVKARDEAHMFKLIRAGFNERRKTLSNAIADFKDLSYTRADIENALMALGMNPKVRGEALGLEEFAKLSDYLTENNHESSIKAVIFDLDGTLLNTLDDLLDSANIVLKEFGYPEIEAEEAAAALGNGFEYYYSHILPDGKENPDWEKSFERLKEVYGERCEIKTRPYDGILEVINEIKKLGLKQAIVSNKPDDRVKDLAKKYFADTMEAAFGEMKGIKRKPAPDVANAVIKELKLEPNECIYVGDSEVDIATAKNAGIRCISVAWGFRTKKQLKKSGASDIIEKPEELLKYLK